MGCLFGPVDLMIMSFGQAHDGRLIDSRGLLRMSQMLVMVGQTLQLSFMFVTSESF
jgi:hypothetical protein